MSRSDPEARAALEAADWCARLNSRSVPTSELEAFYRWRREPANALAYADTERTWKASHALGGEEDVGEALAEVLSRPRSDEPRRRPWYLAFGIGLAGSALAAMALAIWLLSGPLELRTGVGEQRLVRLEDGSRVRLDTDSVVQVDLDGDERRVTLVRGQAFFEVAKDERHPFVVSASGSTVRALGTRFGVRTAGNAVSVVLAEGSVRVKGEGGGEATLIPGSGVGLVGGRLGRVHDVDVDAQTSWTTGRLIFRDTPIASAVVEMNRYSSIPIRLGTGVGARMRVNGAFDTGNTDAFVSSVSAISGLHVDRGTPGVVRLTE